MVTMPNNTRRLLMIIDDKEHEALLTVAKRHLQLAKQGLDTTTTPERKQAIIDEINMLRQQRDQLLSHYQLKYKGEIINE